MPNKGDEKSAMARGYAAKARDVGKADKFDCFGHGRGDGYNRQAANGIVHAESGEARHHMKEAKELFNKAYAKR